MSNIFRQPDNLVESVKEITEAAERSRSDSIYSADRRIIFYKDPETGKRHRRKVHKQIRLDKEDPDINNDGIVDNTDRYLKKRRKAIKKAIGKQHNRKKQVKESEEAYLPLKCTCASDCPCGGNCGSDCNCGGCSSVKESEESYLPLKCTCASDCPCGGNCGSDCNCGGCSSVNEEMRKVEMRKASIIKGKDGRPKWNFQAKRGKTVEEEKQKKLKGTKEVSLKDGDKVVINPKMDDKENTPVNFTEAQNRPTRKAMSLRRWKC